MKSIEKVVPEEFTKAHKSAEKANSENEIMEAAHWTAQDKHGEKGKHGIPVQDCTSQCRKTGSEDRRRRARRKKRKRSREGGRAVEGRGRLAMAMRGLAWCGGVRCSRVSSVSYEALFMEGAVAAKCAESWSGVEWSGVE